MSENYDARLTFRLTGRAKNEILLQAKNDGTTMTEFIRAVISSYLQWRQRQIHGLSM